MDTPVECPTCLGVSRGGRIRVTEETSELLLDCVREQRQNWLQLRRLYIDGGHAEAARAANGKLKTIDLGIAELERTRSEMGWNRGQPQRQDS